MTTALPITAQFNSEVLHNPVRLGMWSTHWPLYSTRIRGSYKGPLLQSEYLGLHISLESVWHVPIWCIACGTHNQKTLHACCSWWTCTCMQVLQGCYSQSSACHALLYIPCEFNYSVDCPRVHSSTLKLYIEWRPHTHTITNL